MDLIGSMTLILNRSCCSVVFVSDHDVGWLQWARRIAWIDAVPPHSGQLAKHVFGVLSGLMIWCVCLPVEAGVSYQETQRHLSQAYQDIEQMRKTRRQLKAQQGAAIARLRQADLQVAKLAIVLQQTEQTWKQNQDDLAQTEEQLGQCQHSLASMQQQMRLMLQQMDQTGSHVPLKLLLAQDQSMLANRQLIYYRYLQQERVRRLAGFAQQWRNLAQLQQQQQMANNLVQQTHQRYMAQLETLKRLRQQQFNAMQGLTSRYQAQTLRQQSRAQDAQNLEQVLLRLRTSASVSHQSTPVESSTHSKTYPHVGGAQWPVSGQLLTRYGAELSDRRISHGLLISAPIGTAVTAVADGTVVFADWMTGYGMILIIDHGHSYLSLYAHNDTLLAHVSSHVRRGQRVATVGNSGGQTPSALYFELRHRGQPVDPATWLNP